MKRVFVIIFFVLVVIHFTGAEVLFYHEPEGIYNIGDAVSVNFSIEENFAISDYVESYISCGSEKFIVRKELINLDADTKKYFAFDFPAPIKGDCRFFVDFNDEEFSTNEFKVSNKIYVDYQINGLSFYPGEKIFINGTARKENNESFYGIANVTISGIHKSVEVTDGIFSLSFDLADISSGDYNLVVSVADRDWKGDILNSGEGTKKINIKSKPTDISIDYDGDISFKPPHDFNFNVSLLDQSGKIISNKSVLVKIFSPLNERIVFEENILSGEGADYFFERNSTPGQWRINAYFGSIFSSRDIDVDENEEAVIEVDSANRAIVKNLGNVIYDGNIIFNLTGEDGIEKEISVNVSNLVVGGSFLLNLEGLKGTYNLSSGGEDFQNVTFAGTGASIFNGSELNSRSYIIGFLILFVFATGFLFRKKLVLFLKKIFRKRERTGKRKVLVKDKGQKVSGSVNACMVFLKFDKFIEMDDLFDAYGFSFKKVSDNLGYVLFYASSEKKPELKMFDFARKVKSIANEHSAKISVVVNSMPYKDMRDIKDFAFFNRKLLDFCDGEILFLKKVFDKTGLHKPRKMKTINVLGEEFEVYLI